MYEEKTAMPVNEPVAQEGICSMAQAIGQMQDETLAVINCIYEVLYGDRTELPPYAPAGCLEQEICQDLDRARSIVNAVKAIHDRLGR